MRAFFFDVGRKGGDRDFPRTIGRRESGLRFFSFAQVADDLEELSAEEKRELAEHLARRAPAGFQIWGVPSGAKSVIDNIREGDVVMLLHSASSDGRFYYAGYVLARPRCHGYRLSLRLWGEKRFPLILFLQGALSEMTWSEFRDAMGYKENWQPAGKTYRILPERLSKSKFATPQGLFSAAVSGFEHQLAPAARLR